MEGTLFGEETDNIAFGEKLRGTQFRSQSGLERFIDESFEKGGPQPEDFHWLNSGEIDNLANVTPSDAGIANTFRINSIQRINKYLEAANQTLEYGDYLLICVETKNSRRARILNKFPKLISRPYYVLDFVLKRVFPKWKPTYKIYFWITKGRNRVLTFTETLGRLYSCGFSVINHSRIGYNTWLIAKKTGEPAYNMEPTYGALVKLNRVGKDGKLIRVYKLRTMHPYSEYIQNYVYEKNSLKKGGKLNGDFRVTSWGKVFRKLWIDELPMLINWARREMKVVGVRPLSRSYYNLYPPDFQELRNSMKPGLVPPYYADMPETLEEIVESERRYIESYRQKPVRTDIRYFFKAMYNILIKRARSA